MGSQQTSRQEEPANHDCRKCEKDKAGHWELHLIEDLHLHLEETGGGKNEAKALSGKRRQQCKGPGAERSRVGRPG